MYCYRVAEKYCGLMDELMVLMTCRTKIFWSLLLHLKTQKLNDDISMLSRGKFSFHQFHTCICYLQQIHFEFIRLVPPHINLQTYSSQKTLSSEVLCNQN